MPSKRFLYVLYEKQPARIDTKDMEDISQVQKEVERWYSKDFPLLTSLRLQLWNKNTTPHIQLDDFDDVQALPEEYYWKPKKSGSLSLTIQLLPSPVSRPESAKFLLFPWKASKKPLKSVSLDLKDGRMPLRSLLSEQGFTELIRMDNGSKLLQDEYGYSTQIWQADETYSLRFKKSSSVDIDIPFGISFDDTLWTYDMDTPMKYPEALAETIGLFAEFNTLRLEPSRRSIVSLFMHYSISAVPSQTSKLCIDEETPIAIVRQVIRNGEPKNVRYHGPIDFVVGHSKILTTMPNDAAVVVIETKRSDTFEESLTQAVAQAAALLYFRRGQNHPEV